MSLMPTMFKCEKCGLSIRHCKCDNLFPQKEGKELGRITPIKGYQTTDGKIYTGKDAQENAEDHQRWLDYKQVILPDEPRKTPLKKRKKKRRKP